MCRRFLAVAVHLRSGLVAVFFFNDTATTEIYTLSLHDALPILTATRRAKPTLQEKLCVPRDGRGYSWLADYLARLEGKERSEEHTSELQSRQYFVCRLLLEKKKKTRIRTPS